MFTPVYPTTTTGKMAYAQMASVKSTRITVVFCSEDNIPYDMVRDNRLCKGQPIESKQ